MLSFFNSPIAFTGNFIPCLHTAVIIKAMKAIMGMNLSTSIVEGSATKDLKGSLRDTGTTSYEFASSFRSTCFFFGIISEPY